MDENAIGITSNAYTEHQISFESGVVGMKLAAMTCIMLHICTQRTQKKN
jgi:hypothetical protein